MENGRRTYQHKMSSSFWNCYVDLSLKFLETWLRTADFWDRDSLSRSKIVRCKNRIESLFENSNLQFFLAREVMRALVVEPTVRRTNHISGRELFLCVPTFVVFDRFAHVNTRLERENEKRTNARKSPFVGIHTIL